jgi:hypothetical protein
MTRTLMGSFSSTCAISGLGIDAGDPVRYMLLTETPYGDDNLSTPWFPRTFPLKGKYDDYGGVEDVEEGPQRDVWMAALQLDIIEREVGDNYIHDVAVTKDMTFEDIQNALWEGRVQVVSDMNRTDFDVGFDGLLEELKDLERAELSDLVAVGNKTMGIEVEPREPRNVKPLRLYQALIREDVWQELILTGLAMLGRKEKDLVNTGIARSHVPFAVGYGTHDALMSRWEINGTVDAAEVERWKRVVGETLVVEEALARARYWWRPSYTLGPQFPDVEGQELVALSLSKVATALAEAALAEAADEEQAD